jgi:hypothetical protein
MGRSGAIRGFTAACVLIFSSTACGKTGDSGQGEDRQEPPLPSTGPSPEADEGANITDNRRKRLSGDSSAPNQFTRINCHFR